MYFRNLTNRDPDVLWYVGLSVQWLLELCVFGKLEAL